MSRRMYSKGQLIKIIQEQGGGVDSVNGKTGTVVLKAEDIKVNNSTSIQANLERIDLEVEGCIDDIADLNTDKLDKVTTVDSFPRVYGVKANGAQEMYGATTDKTGNTIALRDSYGRISCTYPISENQVTTKGYVDQITAVPTLLMDHVAIQQGYDKAINAPSGKKFRDVWITIDIPQTNAQLPGIIYLYAYGGDQILVQVAHDMPGYTIGQPWVVKIHYKNDNGMHYAEGCDHGVSTTEGHNYIATTGRNWSFHNSQTSALYYGFSGTWPAGTTLTVYARYF